MNISASPFENDVFSIEKWNFYYSELYLPNTIFIAIGLFVGISGNAFVIFVYQRGLKNKGQGRFFIPILATVDLASVTACSIYNIVQITRHVTFPGTLICRFFFIYNSCDFGSLDHDYDSHCGDQVSKDLSNY